MRIEQRIIGAFAVLLVTLLAAFAGERLLSYQRWSLGKDPHWYSAKLERGSRVMGSAEFVEERQTMAGGALNLHAWYGFNEVIYRKPVHLKHLEATFSLDLNSYLWIFFDQAGVDRVALRVSRTPFRSSGIYRITPSGRFILETELPPSIGGAERIRIDAADADHFRIELNHFVAQVPRRADAQVVGFKSGAAPSTLKQVRIAGTEGDFEDDFRPPLSWASFGGAFILLMCLSGFVWAFRNTLSFVHVTLAVGVSFFFAASALRFLDAYFYAPFYFYNRANPGRLVGSRESVARLELWRAALFREEEGAPRAMDPYVASVAGLRPPPGNRVPGITRLQWVSPDGAITVPRMSDVDSLSRGKDTLLIVGSSQAWGSGTVIEKETWFSELVRELNSRLKRPVFALNISVSASHLDYLNPYLQEALSHVKPRLVLADIGTNDRELLPQFRANLGKLADIARDADVPVTLVIEPFNGETTGIIEYQTHPIMRDVARERGLPLLEANRYFLEPAVRDSGFLFLDEAHFDSWGQHVFADFLLRRVDWSALGLRRSSGARVNEKL